MVKKVHVPYHDAQRILSEEAFRNYDTSPFSIFIICEQDKLYFSIEDSFIYAQVKAICNNVKELNEFFEEV